MFRRVLLGFCFCAGFGAELCVAQWIQTMPPGGPGGTKGLVSDSKSPNVLYFGDTAGVWRSRDSGATWLLASTGLIAPNGLIAPVGKLVLDPSSRSTLYAAVYAKNFLPPNPNDNVYARAIFKTTNGGGSWEAAAPQRQFYDHSGNPGVNDVTISASSPNILYVTTTKGPGGEGGGVYKTTDGAQSWFLANNGLEGRIVQPIKADPFSPLIAYVGTEAGLYKTVDGGESWAPVSAGLPYPEIFALEIDPNFPNTLYVATSNENFASGGISKSSDGGASWANLQGFPNGKPTVFAIIAPRDAPGRLFAAGLSSVLASDDGGTSWFDVGDPQPPYSIYGLSVVPGSPATLYATTSLGTLWKRTIAPISVPCDRCVRNVPFR